MLNRLPIRRACAAAALLAGGLAGRGLPSHAAQQTTEEQAAVDTTAIRVIIGSLRTAWEAGVAAGDYQSMGALLADGAAMVQPGGSGWDSPATAAAGAPFPPGPTIDITPIEVRVLSPEWAYESGTSAVTYKPTGAAEDRKLSDTYLILFRKTPGDGRSTGKSRAPRRRRRPRRSTASRRRRMAWAARRAATTAASG